MTITRRALWLLPFITLAACGGADPSTEAAVTTKPAPETTVPETTEAPSTTAKPECTEGAVAGVYESQRFCENGEWVADPQPRPTTTTLPPTTTAPPAPLTAADFTIELVVIGDECYNSAGGLVTVEPDLTYLGTPAYTGDALVVYEVHGGEAVETHNLELADGSYTFNQETISTAVCGAPLSAVVTMVRER